MSDTDLVKTQPIRKSKRKKQLPLGLLFLTFIALLTVMTVALAGGFAGYRSAQEELQGRMQAQEVLTVVEQYELGLQDLGEGRYDLARQRFEFVLAQDPDYPGAADNLVYAMQILFATATPTPLPPTVTPTPTRDLRPVEDLYAQANSFFTTGNWNGVIDTLVALRQEDPLYRVVEVDSLLYRTLRNRGIKKIREESNLEGGIYDLALVERFAPLDVEANKWRNLARLYMIGSSFWEVYPELAVYYFGQVASAAPYLRDLTGWTAAERYRAVLFQYGDYLAKNGDWCEAQAQYEFAQSHFGDSGIEPTVSYAALKCSPPTDIPTETATITFTPTITLTGIPGISPTATQTGSPPIATASNTPTRTNTPVSGGSPTSTLTPTSTVTSAPPPPPSPTSTQPPPAETFTPTPTDVGNEVSDE